jgi:hypothetical protein
MPWSFRTGGVSSGRTSRKTLCLDTKASNHVSYLGLTCNANCQFAAQSNRLCYEIRHFLKLSTRDSINEGGRSDPKALPVAT